MGDAAIDDYLVEAVKQEISYHTLRPAPSIQGDLYQAGNVHVLLQHSSVHARIHHRNIMILSLLWVCTTLACEVVQLSNPGTNANSR
jgi:hypothetical protein